MSMKRTIHISPTAVLFFLYFFIAATQSILSVSIGRILGDFSIQNAYQGLPKSGFEFGYLISFLIISTFLSGIHKTSMLWIGIVVSGVVFSIIGYSANPYVFCIGMGIYGLADGFLETGINSQVIEISPADSVGKVNLLHMFFAMGAFSSPLWIAHVVSAFGWRSMYKAASFVMLLFIPLLLLFGRTQHKKDASNPPTSMKSRHTNKVSVVRLLGVLKDRRFLFVILACAVYTAVQYSFVDWVVIYLTTEIGVQAETAAIALTLLWGSIILSRFIASRLHRGALKLFYLSAAICFPIVLTCLLVGSLVCIYISVVFFGLLCGHSIPTLTAHLGSLKAEDTVVALAANNLTVGVLGMLWPLVVALIKTHGSLHLALIVSFFFLPISAILAYYSREKGTNKESII